jgi:hypothetical protein
MRRTGPIHKRSRPGLNARRGVVPDPAWAPYGCISVFASPLDQTVYVQSDDGRVVRPLLSLRPSGELSAPFGVLELDQLLLEKHVVYADAAEVYTRPVRLGPHRGPDPPPAADLMENYPHLILGVTAALIPLLQANQSPRVRGMLYNTMPCTQCLPDVNGSGVSFLQTVQGILRGRRQALGPPQPPGPFDSSPALCYAQRPSGGPVFREPSTEPVVPVIGNRNQYGEHGVRVPHGTESDRGCGPVWTRGPWKSAPWLFCERRLQPTPCVGAGPPAYAPNDSVVLNRHAIQRGLGTSLSFHTRRFDVHPPCKLFASHPSIPGGLGVVIPGHAVHVNSVMLAAHVPRSRWLSGIAIRWIRWLQMPHREGSRHPFYDAHRRTTSEFFTGWL